MGHCQKVGMAASAEMLKNAVISEAKTKQTATVSCFGNTVSALVRLSNILGCVQTSLSKLI